MCYNEVEIREPLETFDTKKSAESYQSKIQSEIDNNTFINTPDITFSEATIPKTDEEKIQDVVIDDVENYKDDELYEEEDFITPEQAIQVINLFMNTD